MLRPLPPGRRAGAVLLVVLVMLALFASLGLAFVLYSQSQGEVARVRMQSLDTDGTGATAPVAGDFVNAFLGQLLYDVSDTDPSEAQSSLRGHSLARTMYGWRFDTATANLSAFSGEGLFPENTAPKRETVVNFAVTPVATNPVFDPEWTGTRANLATAIDTATRTYKNLAAPYTFPDKKDFFLAQIDPSALGSDPAGTPAANFASRVVKEPSFHRYGAPGTTDPTVFNDADAEPWRRLAPPNGTANAVSTTAATDWTTPAGRYKIVRPRPFDHAYDSGDGRSAVSDFPYPLPNADGTYTGDVQNWPNTGGVQRHDSVWVYPSIPLGGAAPLRKWNNKWYTALVAPMIVDLSGRVNLSVAGNLQVGKTATASGTDHASSMGLGPWEINPRWALFPGMTTRPTRASWMPPTGLPTTPASTFDIDPLERLIGRGTLFAASGGPATPAGGRYGHHATAIQQPPADRYSNQNRLEVLSRRPIPPFYGRVDADADGSGTPASPVGTSGSLFPTFDPARYYADATAQGTELGNHPGQYRPEVAAGAYDAAVRGAQALGSRAGDVATKLSGVGIARAIPELLLAGPTGQDAADPSATPGTSRYDPTKPPSVPANVPVTPAALDTTYNPVGTNLAGAGDPATLIRMLTTTFNSSTHRPVMELKDNSTPPTVLARFGPIDMARALPDYRKDPTKLLLPDNIDLAGSTGRAQLARQHLARDIFLRLVAVYHTTTPLIDGTKVVYINDPALLGYGYLHTPTAGGGLAALKADTVLMPKLRQLAQLAVNIVDAVDSDDINTTFTWLPLNDAGDQFHLDNSATGNGLPIIAGTNGFAATEFTDRVVYGTELPRVVLNEVIATLDNNRADYNPPSTTTPPTDTGPPGYDDLQQPLEKRFFVELHNTVQEDKGLSENGAARLAFAAGFPGVTAGYAPYQLAIGTGVATVFHNPENVTGSPRHTSAAGFQLQLLVDKYTYDNTDTTPKDSTLDADVHSGGLYAASDTVTGAITATTNKEENIIRPSTPGSDGTSRQNVNGYYVLGPTEEYPGQTAPTPAQVGATMRVTPDAASAGQNGTPGDKPCRMQVATGTAKKVSDVLPTPDMTQNIVLLRRLANPYLPPNDPLEPGHDATKPVNPYITVDAAYDIALQNNVHFEKDGTAPLTPTVTDFASRGRRHSFGETGVAAQTTAVPSSPKSTFFKRNDNAPPATPSRWLAHLDRAPLNPLEVVSASASASHRLTQLFDAAGAGTGNGHAAQRFFMPGMAEGTDQFAGAAIPSDGFMLPALDLLGVRLPQTGVALGAPVQGRVNVNAANHPAVTRALTDRNVANYFSDADVDVLQSGLAATISNTAPTAGGPVRGLAGSAGRPQSTLFRQNVDASNNPTGRHLFLPDVGQAPISGLQPEAQEHAYLRTELARKIWQSHSTTSDSFLVLMTVGFFEVRNVNAAGQILDPAGGPGLATDANRRLILGRELFAQTPGDTRVKYAAVVDRGQLAMPIQTTGTPGAIDAGKQAKDPWTTVTQQDLAAGAATGAVVADGIINPAYNTPPPLGAFDPAGYGFQVYRNGALVTVKPGDIVRIGFGDTASLGEGTSYRLTGVSPVLDPAVPAPGAWWPGRVELQLAPLAPATTTNYHPAGSVVTNVVFGNPGPAAKNGFDPAKPEFKAVVPVLTKVD